MTATLLLDRTAWDLTLDSSGNVALATEPYSILQDVASACRLFLNELWYGQGRGIPYFQQILGRPQRSAYLKTQLQKAALTVPGVLSARVYLTAIKDRSVSGQVQIETAAGAAIVTL